MLKKIDTIKTPYLLYRLYNNVIIIFDDIEYIKKQEIKNIDNDSHFLLKDASISFFDQTTAIEIQGTSININKLNETDEIESSKDWKIIVSNYTIISTPSKVSGQQILNG